jgi:predicted dinucleotide-binding enzyme
MGLALAGGLRRAEVPVRGWSGRRHTTESGRHDLDDLLTWASVLIPAVPFPVVLKLASGPLSGRGAGRTLIDVTNPAMATAQQVVPGRSGGERIAEAATGWRVVKAFNTVSAALLEQSPYHRQPPSLLVATDHEPALNDTFSIARSLGLQPLNVGGIDNSLHLESLAVLLRQISTRHRCTGRVTITIDAAPDERRDETGRREQPAPPQPAADGPIVTRATQHTRKPIGTGHRSGRGRSSG